MSMIRDACDSSSARSALEIGAAFGGGIISFIARALSRKNPSVNALSCTAKDEEFTRGAPALCAQELFESAAAHAACGRGGFIGARTRACWIASRFAFGSRSQ